MAPNQTTEQASPRRRTPRPSRAAGGEPDLTTRRLIAAAVIIVFLIFIVLGVRGCLGAREERAIKDFVKESNAILTQSNQSSREFFNVLQKPGDAGATEIETSINVQRSLASELVQQASNLDAPGDMAEAKRYLIQTLELRRDGLTEISGLIGQALGDQDPESAAEQIAANMQFFLSSDVIYSQRAYAYMNQAVKDNDIQGQKLPASRYLPSLDWLDPATVDDTLSRVRGGSSDEAVAPGLHGTGIVGVKALPSGTTLSDGASLTDVQTIQVDVQNQGENEEKGVVVTLRISGAGSPIQLQETIRTIEAGETKNVTIPVTRTPAKGSSATLRVEVRRVPGEENTDNNRQQFNVTF